MMKKAFFISLVGISALSPLFCSANSASQQDWKEVKSCIDLSNQLKKLIADSHFDSTITVFPKNKMPLIDDGQLSFSSSTFFANYNEQKQLLTIIKGPKDAKNTLIDFNKAKKIAKIQFPHDFQEVETLFFKEEILILSANRLQKNKNPETLVMFYEIKNDKLTPLHFFKHNGEKVKRKIINEKLYLITQTPISQPLIQAIIKKDGDLPDFFPILSEGLSYGLKTSSEKAARCQDFKYLFVKNNQLPQLWSILVSDLNALHSAKERAYFLGNFNQIHFSNDFLYVTSESEGGTTLAQRFALEPKLNFQSSELLDGNILSNGILTEKTKSAFITERSSGKLKSYLITPFDERFIKQESLELLSENENYKQAQLFQHQIYLGNDQQLSLIGKQSDGWNFQSLTPQTFLKKQNSFFLGLTTGILEIRQEQEQILLIWQEWNPKSGSFQEHKIIALAHHNLFGMPSRNAKNTLLLLPLLQKTETKNQISIKGFMIKENKILKPLFARNYPKNTSPFSEIIQLPLFSYAINGELIDLFLPQQITAMKVFNTK